MRPEVFGWNVIVSLLMSVGSFFWRVLTDGLACRMMQITFAEHLDHWQELAQLLGIALHPNGASSLPTQLDQLTHLLFLSLKLWQKISSGAKVMTGVAGCVLCWAIGFLGLETVAIGQADCIQVVPDMLPFDLMLVGELSRV